MARRKIYKTALVVLALGAAMAASVAQAAQVECLPKHAKLMNDPRANPALTRRGKGLAIDQDKLNFSASADGEVCITWRLPPGQGRIFSIKFEKVPDVQTGRGTPVGADAFSCGNGKRPHEYVCINYNQPGIYKYTVWAEADGSQLLPLDPYVLNGP